MLKLVKKNEGEMSLAGRLDAVEVDKIQSTFDNLTHSVVLDCKDLDYISSAGLGLLISTQLRLNKSGANVKLINVGKFVRDVLRFSGFDKILEVSEA